MDQDHSLNVDVPRFASLVVLDEKSNQIMLGHLWNKQPIIFVFLRHFACISCRAHAQQVWSQRQMYEGKGAKIVFIGNGAPHFIQKFREDIQVQGALILTDPSLEAFHAAGFRKGFLSVVSVQSALNVAKLIVQERELTGYETQAGSFWQLGGIIAILPSSKVAYQFVSEAIGDFPPEKDTEEIGELAASGETDQTSVA